MNPATISKLSVFVLSTFAFSGLAGAEGPRAERLQALSQKLAVVESQLNPEDLRGIEHHLAGIDRILYRYQAAGQPAAQPVAQLTCLSNGQAGNYEKFT